MPVPLTALLAAALHQVRMVQVDPVAVTRSAELLAYATPPGKVTWELDGDGLLVNGTPVPPGAPGAATLRTALRQHRIARLTLPASLSARQWQEVVVVLGSASGIYAGPAQLLHAIHQIAPGTDLLPAPDESAGEGLRVAITDLDRSTLIGVPEREMAPDLTTSSTDRAALSVQLDPLLDRCNEAALAWDWGRLAEGVLELHAMEMAADAGTRSVILQERRRVIPADTLRRFICTLPTVAVGSPIARAISCLGWDGVETLLEALSEGPSRAERRVFIEALIAARDADELLLRALNTTAPVLLSDITEVMGRRRMERAVPQLIKRLHHDDEKVRSATWHALEQIGTPAALAALK